MTRVIRNPSKLDAEPLIIVKKSGVHGNGVFAARRIGTGTCILEYQGERIDSAESARRSGADPDNPFHTFFFSLEDGRLIDGAVDGNEARWINHGCAPNCEAREVDGKIFIYALRAIKRDEELSYDYGLVTEQRHTAALKRAYACRCGAPECRHSMLAPKRRVRSKPIQVL